MTEWDTSEVTCHPARLPFYINRADPNTKICMQISRRAARFQDRERGRELFSDWSAHVITDQSRHIHCRQLGIEGSIESRRVCTLPEKKKADLVGQPITRRANRVRPNENTGRRNPHHNPKHLHVSENCLLGLISCCFCCGWIVSLLNSGGFDDWTWVDLAQRRCLTEYLSVFMPSFHYHYHWPGRDMNRVWDVRVIWLTVDM